MSTPNKDIFCMTTHLRDLILKQRVAALKNSQVLTPMKLYLIVYHVQIFDCFPYSNLARFFCRRLKSAFYHFIYLLCSQHHFSHCFSVRKQSPRVILRGSAFEYLITSYNSTSIRINKINLLSLLQLFMVFAKEAVQVATNPTVPSSHANSL